MEPASYYDVTDLSRLSTHDANPRSSPPVYAEPSLTHYSINGWAPLGSSPDNSVNDIKGDKARHLSSYENFDSNETRLDSSFDNSVLPYLPNNHTSGICNRSKKITNILSTRIRQQIKANIGRLPPIDYGKFTKKISGALTKSTFFNKNGGDLPDSREKRYDEVVNIDEDTNYGFPPEQLYDMERRVELITGFKLTAPTNLRSVRMMRSSNKAIADISPCLLSTAPVGFFQSSHSRPVSSYVEGCSLSTPSAQTNLTSPNFSGSTKLKQRPHSSINFKVDTPSPFLVSAGDWDQSPANAKTSSYGISDPIFNVDIRRRPFGATWIQYPPFEDLSPTNCPRNRDKRVPFSNSPKSDVSHIMVDLKSGPDGSAATYPTSQRDTDPLSDGNNETATKMRFESNFAARVSHSSQLASLSDSGYGGTNTMKRTGSHATISGCPLPYFDPPITMYNNDSSIAKYNNYVGGKDGYTGHPSWSEGTVPRSSNDDLNGREDVHFKFGKKGGSRENLDENYESLRHGLGAAHRTSILTLASKLDEKEAQIRALGAAMARNENAIIRVYEEKLAHYEFQIKVLQSEMKRCHRLDRSQTEDSIEFGGDYIAIPPHSQVLNFIPEKASPARIEPASLIRELEECRWALCRKNGEISYLKSQIRNFSSSSLKEGGSKNF